VARSSSLNNSKPAGSLEKNLATILLQSATTVYNDDPIVHPVVCMNAIKNILGDVRDSPSEILLTYAGNYIAGLKPRDKDKKVFHQHSILHLILAINHLFVVQIKSVYGIKYGWRSVVNQEK